MQNIIVIYMTIINIVSFFAFGIDKSKAKRGSFRISEKTLLSLCVVGGSIGGIIGMQIFHHKTKHIIFKLGVPTIIVLQYGLVLLYIYRGLLG